MQHIYIIQDNCDAIVMHTCISYTTAIACPPLIFVVNKVMAAIPAHDNKSCHSKSLFGQ